MDVRIEINKEWLEKNNKEFSKRYDEQEYLDVKDKGKGYLIDIELENNEMLVDKEDKIQVSAGNDDLYVGFTEKPSIDELLNLAQIISKYYNKAKSAIESLK